MQDPTDEFGKLRADLVGLSDAEILSRMERIQNDDGVDPGVFMDANGDLINVNSFIMGNNPFLIRSESDFAAAYIPPTIEHRDMLERIGFELIRIVGVDRLPHLLLSIVLIIFILLSFLLNGK